MQSIEAFLHVKSEIIEMAEPVNLVNGDFTNWQALPICMINTHQTQPKMVDEETFLPISGISGKNSKKFPIFGGALTYNVEIQRMSKFYSLQDRVLMVESYIGVAKLIRTFPNTKFLRKYKRTYTVLYYQTRCMTSSIPQ